MRCRLSVYLCVCLLIVLLVTPAQAQETGETVWYFAASETQLIAYSLDGQANVLLEDAKWDRPIRRGFRLSSDRALLLVENDDGTVPLLATANDVSVIGTEPLPDSFILHSWHAPYLIFTNDPSQSSAGWIIDTESLTVSALTGFNALRLPTQHMIRFMPDGQTLRYFSQTEDDFEAPGTLWERNLVTGKENALYTAEGRFSFVASTTDGQGWWFVYPAEDGQADITTFGNTPEIVTPAFQERRGYLLPYADVLVEVNFQCEADCPVELTSIYDRETTSYTLPVQAGFPTVRHIYENGILVDVSGENIWFLEPGNAASYLGEWSSTNLATSGMIYASLDWRWVVGIEESDNTTWTYRVQEMPQIEVVMMDTAEQFVIVLFGPDAVMTQNFTDNTYTLYNATTGEMVSLPNAAEIGIRYGEILPDGRLLVEQIRDSEERAAGLYVYDPATETYTLLIESVYAIGLRNLEQEWR